MLLPLYGGRSAIVYGPSPGPPPTYPAPGSEASGGAIPMVSEGNAGFGSTRGGGEQAEPSMVIMFAALALVAEYIAGE